MLIDEAKDISEQLNTVNERMVRIYQKGKNHKHVIPFF